MEATRSGQYGGALRGCVSDDEYEVTSQRRDLQQEESEKCSTADAELTRIGRTSKAKSEKDGARGAKQASQS